MTLKGICNTLSRKTQALDVLLLFVEPRIILQPLCHLLDGWQDSEEQSKYTIFNHHAHADGRVGEHHAVYDEFGSILMLVIVFHHHFQLHETDLGITYPDSFLRNYFRSGSVPQAPRDMPDTDRQRLRTWIKGLYETEGISDELMSTCSPKEFHLLVATIFDQSLMACQAGVLSQEKIKGVFECMYLTCSAPSTQYFNLNSSPLSANVPFRPPRTLPPALPRRSPGLGHPAALGNTPARPTLGDPARSTCSARAAC